MCSSHFKNTGSFKNANEVTLTPLPEFPQWLFAVFRPNTNSQCGNKGSPRPGPGPASQPHSLPLPHAHLQGLASTLDLAKSHFSWLHLHSSPVNLPLLRHSTCLSVPESSLLDVTVLWAGIRSFHLLALLALAPSRQLRTQQGLNKYLLKQILANSYSQILILKNPNSLEYRPSELHKSWFW